MTRLVLLLAALLAMQAPRGGSSGDEWQAARRLGKAYYEEGDYRNAAEQFRKVLRAQPGRGSFADHLNLGLALVGLPDEAGALAELETARQMNPSSPAPLYGLAILHKRQGHFREALDFLQRAEKAGAGDLATLFNTGAVLMALGRNEEALACFQRLLERGPDFGPGFFIAAEYRSSRLLQRLGRAEEAARVLKQWEARKKAMREPNDSPTMLELGPLASPQIPRETVEPRRSVLVPAFAAPVRQPASKPAAAILFDFDVDGDLDRLTVPPACGVPRLERNNGNGTYTDVTAAAGLSAPKPVCGAAAADFDNDGDPDIAVAGRDGAWLFNNLRGGKFRLETPFGRASGTSIEAADLDGDGAFDVVFGSPDSGSPESGSPSSLAVWWNRGAPDSGVSLTAIEGVHAPFTVADLNGDGLPDIVAAGAKRLEFRLNLAGRQFQPQAGPALPGGVRALAAVYPNPGALSLVATGVGGAAWRFDRTAPQPRWLRLSLEGVRSNKEGIGAVVEVKAGNFYTRRIVRELPVVVETGTLAKVDVVRVTWPNGIVQNVIETATNRDLRLAEQDRLASSCPLLYLWDGAQFRFFAEVLSSTPLGEPDGRGGFILPGRRESVFLPGERVAARGGRYVFQLTEELREAVYLDAARLVALDHPAGTPAFVDEAYRGAPLEMPPVLLRDVAVVETRREPDSPREDALPGLMQKHATYFGLPDGADFLVLRGWVYWMDSNIAAAASQDPSRAPLLPVLEARQPDGSWRAVIEDLGLPAGAGRHVLADLRGRVRPGAHLRITTNLRVFWHEVLAGRHAGAPRRSALRPAGADLHYRGFSVPTISAARNGPDWYDYSRLLAQAPWNALPGRYTRYGDIRPLVVRADDRLAVLGAGDELTLEFPQALPPLPPGWRRDFALELSGWAKAGETNTAASESVEPLPFRAMKQYPHRAATDSPWRRRWLTRQPMPLLPALALAH